MELLYCTKLFLSKYGLLKKIEANPFDFLEMSSGTKKKKNLMQGIVLGISLNLLSWNKFGNVIYEQIPIGRKIHFPEQIKIHRKTRKQICCFSFQRSLGH